MPSLKNVRTVLVGALLLTASTRAAANGRYPAASHIVFDPSDAKHFVVSATIGLLETRDGGKTFAWRCESALGKILSQDLMVAVTANGTTVTTKYDGLAATSDGCAFRSIPDFVGKSVDDLTLSRSAPHSPLAFFTEGGASGATSQLVRSDDDGTTWAAVGPVLPADVTPLTVDVAPSDASRVYLSGSLDLAHESASVLLRSDDGGATFTRADIPGTAGYHLAWIAAVHPLDADRVFVRVQDPAGTIILSSADGGRTFQKIFTGTAQLLGFAVSPDGAEMAVGGPKDGIWVGASDGTNLARRSDVPPTCLAWNTDGLYACSDWKVAGFSIGRSVDRGATFETVLRFDSLCGQTACGADTAVGMLCPLEWGNVAPALGATCGLDAGALDAGASDVAIDTIVDDAAEGGPSVMDASTSPPPPPVENDGGCALVGGPKGPPSHLTGRGARFGPAALLFAFLCVILRRGPFRRVRL
jgi:photosystem II stability/assembly factor-like uncharacterized protein